jgi:hypothetical protein
MDTQPEPRTKEKRIEDAAFFAMQSARWALLDLMDAYKHGSEGAAREARKWLSEAVAELDAALGDRE